MNFIFNFKERFFHRLTAEEESLILNTNLFQNDELGSCKGIFESARKVKYSASEQILHEEEYDDDALYIIGNGSVRIFTYDLSGNKIPLARLERGQYFGEQATLQDIDSQRTRSANVEAITDVTLIRLDAGYLRSISEIICPLKAKVTQIGYQQAIKTLISVNDFYGNLETILLKKENKILEFDKDDTIFNMGDEPDHVYIILQGEVKLLIPEKGTSKLDSLILKKGDLFGELASLKDIRRSASAIAETHVRLLAIKGKDFKNHIAENPKLEQLIARLHQTYQLPKKGKISQYLDTLQGVGPAITNLYEMGDQRTIIASTLLDQNAFIMSVKEKDKDRAYLYKKGDERIELGVADKRIVEIRAEGFRETLPGLSHLLISGEQLDEEKYKEFELNGKIESAETEEDKSEIVCVCMSVTRKELQQLIDQGAKSIRALSEKTGVCTSCGGCKPKILQMLGLTPWFSASMRKEEEHNSYIRSFLIRPSQEQFKQFIAGEHLIIQAKIGDIWVERPYTITGATKDNELRITIKKEPQGYFTGWLYDQSPPSFPINVTHPQGNFTLKLEMDAPILCFAGGIGITPFISFAKTFASQDKGNKKMHILYSVLDEKGFVFRNEFDNIIMTTPCFSIQYRVTNTEGLLTVDEVIKNVKIFDQPDVYICGPGGFVKLVQDSLEQINYDKNKIYVEKFLHAGSAGPPIH